MQLFGGIVTVSVGHCHDKVNEAVLRQNSLLQHTTTIYLNNEVAEYAKELTDKLPEHLSVRISSPSFIHSSKYRTFQLIKGNDPIKWNGSIAFGIIGNLAYSCDTVIISHRVLSILEKKEWENLTKQEDTLDLCAPFYTRQEVKP